MVLMWLLDGGFTTSRSVGPPFLGGPRLQLVETTTAMDSIHFLAFVSEVRLLPVAAEAP